jgi:hypothetical protein
MLLPASAAFADIILDDFTDSAVGEVRRFADFVETLNVGELNSRREIRTRGSDVTGSLDVNVASPGQMTMAISEVQQESSGFPSTYVSFDYYFAAPMDVTEGGMNDAILFDFAELVGDVQPRYLEAFAIDNTHVGDAFLIRLSPIVANASPHTLIAPFDQFTFRAPGDPDPTTLREVRFNFFFSQMGQLNWSARLERIRFGPSIVPEPTTTLLVSWGVSFCCCYCLRRKGVEHVARNSEALLDLAGIRRGACHERTSGARCR